MFFIQVKTFSVNFTCLFGGVSPIVGIELFDNVDVLRLKALADAAEFLAPNFLCFNVFFRCEQLKIFALLLYRICRNNIKFYYKITCYTDEIPQM